MSPCTLALLDPVDRALVRRIQADDLFEHRLMDLGLTPFTEIALVRRAPFFDPLELVFRGALLTIRRT